MTREALARGVNLVRGLVRARALLDGATPHEVVWRSGPVAVRRYRPARPAPGAAPLLLVTPLINRYRVVDLDERGSLVGSLVARGIEVFLVDWGDPRRIDAGLDFEDYVLRFLPRARALTGAARVDVLGYCLGGTLAVMFAARFPRQVRRLVTIHAPVDFAPMELFRTWVDPRWFPVERLTRSFGLMPGALVAQGFAWQHPLQSALKLSRAWPRFSDADFAASFCALESWNQDGVDIPGAAYRRLIQDLYRDNRLVAGTFLLGGRPVDPGAISCPVLVASAAQDTTCPPAAAKALLERVGRDDGRALDLPGGHVATVVGPKARAALHHPIADWLLA